MTHADTPAPPIEHCFEDRDALAADLARTVTSTLLDGLSRAPRATLAVSGGSTPVPFFRALGTGDLPWARIDVTLADERWVAPDHDDSNERLVRETLLGGDAAGAGFIPLKTSAPSPEAGARECEERLRGLPWPLDAVILGMGSDGHTASLFPHAPALATALDPDCGSLCIPVTPETAPHARMSLTLPALLNTHRLILHITGADKWDVYQQALAGDDAFAMPVRAVLHQRHTPVHVYWAP
ncbi:6-phosphogluconolactonase [Aquisalimonas asiatica]|uniref:6-phosphogluconolactonase n=1 Tax=Aquisalimonas asiatica TaxID=406100 RepID=A0A1H8RKA6_9GAMM|nr:6-phosphogluconolactonase [Aquisalimonas asiatica]SEO66403.1 6-phosphogluconolactonase [Aquisalimonas asiatica]